MLDGIWWVYRPDGTYLGVFQTRMGNDVLQLSKEVATKVSVGDILHMDETHSQKAWEVRVGENYRGRPNERWIERLSDRTERYPDRKLEVRVRR